MNFDCTKSMTCEGSKLKFAQFTGGKPKFAQITGGESIINFVI
jgi:hypothetical protein